MPRRSRTGPARTGATTALLVAVALAPLVVGAAGPMGEPDGTVGGRAPVTWWHATRDGDAIDVDHDGCAPPWRAAPDTVEAARSLSLELSAACVGIGGGLGTAPSRRGPEVGARPGNLVAVGDLDGDGVRDVAVIPANAQLPDQHALDLRSGSTGELLWTHRSPGVVAAAGGGNVGAQDSPGVVVANLVEADVDAGLATSGAHVLEVRGLDATGQQMWVHRVVGAQARSTDVGAEVDVAWIAGLADLVGDPTTDVVVARDRVVTVLGNVVHLFAVDVLDGRTGEVAGTATIDGTGIPWVDVVGDVDGDLRADLALNLPEPSAETDVELWRGDGTRLWDVPFPKAVFAVVTSVGDIDGDGLGDVVASGGNVDDGWAVAARGIDGSKLYTLQSEAFNSVFSPGDLDGDGRVEVGIDDVDLLGLLLDPAAPVELRHRLVDPSGAVIAEEVDRAQADMDAVAAFLDAGSAQISVAMADAGDVDEDPAGVHDRFFELAGQIGDGSDPVRVGTAGLRRGNDLVVVREVDVLVAEPLRGTVDGHGADILLRTTAPDGRRLLTVQDGLTGGTIASTVEPTRGSTTTLRAANLDRGGADELLATTFSADFAVIGAGVLRAPDLARSWWLGNAD